MDTVLHSTCFIFYIAMPTSFVATYSCKLVQCNQCVCHKEDTCHCIMCTGTLPVEGAWLTGQEGLKVREVR